MAHQPVAATAPVPQREPVITDIIAAMREYMPAPDLNMVRRAFVFAEQHHRPQRRKSGAPYIGHPVAVARILCDLKLDEETICAALMHDTVEDTSATLEDVEAVFNKSIAELVDGVTKLNQIRFRSNEEKQAENFRKMLVAMSRDIRVILVKLADRTHNMRTLDHLAPDKRIGIARETMDIFAPLANRLGLGAVKAELEDLAFRHLEPEEHASLEAKVNERIEQRRDYIDDVVEELAELVRREGIEAEVAGRPKHFWSIHRKMQRQRIPFEHIHDLIAFRVLVAEQRDCYHVLGLIHDRWRPVPGRFKDYVALPKANKYQSLHTTVIGPGGHRIEIQIRTHAMHRVAEGGIAAHWKYKEGGRGLEQKDEERFDWLKRLMEWQQELDDPSEFLESVKVELFQEEVYTFTPAGELKVLPRLSTPVDFAYAVHSEVGNHCSRAAVNGSIVPLDHQLRNGDVVEIFTTPSQRPSKDWLRFVQTTRARNRIRAHIKRESRDRSLELGEQLLDKGLRRFGRSLAKVRKTPGFKEAAQHLNLASGDEMIVQVGNGKLTPESVVHAVLPPEVTGKPRNTEPERLNVISRLIRRVTGGPTGVVVDGLEGVKHTIAKCCSPVPGEAIVGFVTPGHVVSVHRRGCQNALSLDADRAVDVRWGNAGGGYPVDFLIITEAGVPGTLSRMTKVFGDMKVNIERASCEDAGDGRAENLFTVLATDVDQVTQLTRRLASLKGVFSVERVRSVPRR
ncbi:MAG: bifunctional (p)ppGpp synthetase/guanosine-3',5'-bis(diphosphate) 3'-pyrophosphohydrolase [Deltaproteobacteria bacterium]|nr:bifunctional (p)ppGpp synthetase/guanosine-3',5'-bis(diphosphate) 3'-pyrophosphohydrolase [Deltaproteobacteria bacterium]MCB9787311.1 bifunctional (p)ppGpp synthetase/guanosine-3',5'-bis(diphosphate) 3'-pyrophosphohydrolase [Deltaproteobacteria bacterium]